VSVSAAPVYAASNLSLGEGVNSAKGNEQPTDLFGAGGVFQTITNVLLFIIGAVSVIMLIIGGVRYTISQGDSSAVTSAKNTILYAVIGLIVAILAYAVVNFVIVQFVATP
jgi:glucose uptake protein GlcU